MRKAILVVAALAGFALLTPPVSAQWIHHPHAGVRVYRVAPSRAVQTQGVWMDLAGAILPGLLNQFHVQLPPWVQIGNQPGQSGAATPVPADVAKTLTEIGPQLDDVLKRSKSLLPETVQPKPK
jgi:hypothetical protein